MSAPSTSVATPPGVLRSAREAQPQLRSSTLDETERGREREVEWQRQRVCLRLQKYLQTAIVSVSTTYNWRAQPGSQAGTQTVTPAHTETQSHTHSGTHTSSRLTGCNCSEFRRRPLRIICIRPRVGPVRPTPLPLPLPLPLSPPCPSVWHMSGNSLGHV